MLNKMLLWDKLGLCCGALFVLNQLVGHFASSAVTTSSYTATINTQWVENNVSIWDSTQQDTTEIPISKDVTKLTAVDSSKEEEAHGNISSSPLDYKGSTTAPNLLRPNGGQLHDDIPVNFNNFIHEQRTTPSKTKVEREVLLFIVTPMVVFILIVSIYFGVPHCINASKESRNKDILEDFESAPIIQHEQVPINDDAYASASAANIHDYGSYGITNAKEHSNKLQSNLYDRLISSEASGCDTSRDSKSDGCERGFHGKSSTAVNDLNSGTDVPEDISKTHSMSSESAHPVSDDKPPSYEDATNDANTSS